MDVYIPCWGWTPIIMAITTMLAPTTLDAHEEDPLGVASCSSHA